MFLWGYVGVSPSILFDGALQGVLEEARSKNEIPIIVSCSYKSSITVQQRLLALESSLITTEKKPRGAILKI